MQEEINRLKRELENSRRQPVIVPQPLPPPQPRRSSPPPPPPPPARVITQQPVVDLLKKMSDSMNKSKLKLISNQNSKMKSFNKLKIIFKLHPVKVQVNVN